jgi:hypothetical protein
MNSIIPLLILVVLYILFVRVVLPKLGVHG